MVGDQLPLDEHLDDDDCRPVVDGVCQRCGYRYVLADVIEEAERA